MTDVLIAPGSPRIFTSIALTADANGFINAPGAIKSTTYIGPPGLGNVWTFSANCPNAENSANFTAYVSDFPWTIWTANGPSATIQIFDQEHCDISGFGLTPGKVYQFNIIGVNLATELIPPVLPSSGVVTGNVGIINNNAPIIAALNFTLASGNPASTSPVNASAWQSILVTMGLGPRSTKIEVVWLTSLTGVIVATDTFHVANGQYFGQAVIVKAPAFFVRITAYNPQPGDSWPLVVYGLISPVPIQGVTPGPVVDNILYSFSGVVPAGGSTAVTYANWAYSGPADVAISSGSNSGALGYTEIEYQGITVMRNVTFGTTFVANGTTQAGYFASVWLGHYISRFQMINGNAAAQSMTCSVVARE